MLALLLLSTLASFVASAVLGTRLLRLAARTREFPELAIGTSFIVAGVMGYVLMLMGNPGNQRLSTEQVQAFFAAGYALIGFGVACIYVFIWRTFRPDAVWARRLALAGCGALACTAVPEMGSGSGQLVERDALFWLGIVARVGAGVWGAVESLRWWLLLQRRLTLGLADAVVANRFLLWGCANVCTFLIFLSTAFTKGGAEGEGALTPGVILLISSLTLAAAVTQWLAFFPSDGYAEWIRQRARARFAPVEG
jgi:hypothetical protein